MLSVFLVLANTKYNVTQIHQNRSMATIVTDRNLILDNAHTELSENVRWSWACRILDQGSRYRLDTTALAKPRVGDLVLVKIQQIGYHDSIVTIDNKKIRIYENDLLVCVLGNRYATDAFEGEVDDVQNLSMLTAGGMVGTLRSRHRDIKAPTSVSFVGFLNDENGQRINLKRLKLDNVSHSQPRQVKNLLAIVGTAMNSGKTTTARKIIKRLSEMGLKVSACKITGSVSNRDSDEMRSASAKLITDFSDYGFPSTYLCSKEELMTLFNTMLTDMSEKDHDIIVMEIADGILQRETAMLLADQSVKQAIKGIILTADNAPSALYATDYLKKLGYNIIAVSGAITSSPLSVREFMDHSEIYIASSADSGRELANVIAEEFYNLNLVKEI